MVDLGWEQGRITYEMNITNTTIANILTTNSPLLNLGAAQTAVVIAATLLGAFYAGRLTMRLARWTFSF